MVPDPKSYAKILRGRGWIPKKDRERIAAHLDALEEQKALIQRLAFWSSAVLSRQGDQEGAQSNLANALNEARALLYPGSA